MLRRDPAGLCARAGKRGERAHRQQHGDGEAEGEPGGAGGVGRHGSTPMLALQRPARACCRHAPGARRQLRPAAMRAGRVPAVPATTPVPIEPAAGRSGRVRTRLAGAAAVLGGCLLLGPLAHAAIAAAPACAPRA